MPRNEKQGRRCPLSLLLLIPPAAICAPLLPISLPALAGFAIVGVSAIACWRLGGWTGRSAMAALRSERAVLGEAIARLRPAEAEKRAEYFPRHGNHEHISGQPSRREDGIGNGSPAVSKGIQGRRNLVDR